MPSDLPMGPATAESEAAEHRQGSLIAYEKIPRCNDAGLQSGVANITSIFSSLFPSRTVVL